MLSYAAFALLTFCFLQAAEQPVDDLMDLVKQIVPFHVKVKCRISRSGFILELVILVFFNYSLSVP